MFGQNRDVLRPIPQRRRFHRKSGKSKIEILPKVAGRDFRMNVSVGGCHNTHINTARLARSDRRNLAVFKHPQQLGLKRMRHVADFIKKQRAAIGELKITFPNCSSWWLSSLSPDTRRYTKSLGTEYVISGPCDDPESRRHPNPPKPGLHIVAGASDLRVPSY
ncbi:MAG: hypothetical protein JWL90_1233 [Chthoniobacteraceae bacterium]|nr:hypothetical protein [Chthoniobacteraceae bacterium]